jgi:hypothetical protein
MTVIHVPRPSKKAMDPQRPASSLLKMQIEHLQQAELRLPLRYQTGIYVNAIKTEGEAAEYIGAVTKAIHDAHQDAAAKRRKPLPTHKTVAMRRRVLEIAAAAERKSARKRSRKSPAKKKSRSKSKRKNRE